VQKVFLHLVLFFVAVGIARGLTIAGKEAKPGPMIRELGGF